MSPTPHPTCVNKMFILDTIIDSSSKSFDFKNYAVANAQFPDHPIDGSAPRSAAVTLGMFIDEKSRTTEAESGLQTAVDNEASRALYAEGLLQSAVNSEATRAKVVESALQTALDIEETRAKGAESGLQTAVDSEATRAKGAEGELQSALDKLRTVVGAVPDQISTLSNIVKLISELPPDQKASIVTLISQVKEDITTETTRSEGIESAINLLIGKDTSSDTFKYISQQSSKPVTDFSSAAYALQQEVDDNVNLRGDKSSLLAALSNIQGANTISQALINLETSITSNSSSVSILNGDLTSEFASLNNEYSSAYGTNVDTIANALKILRQAIDGETASRMMADGELNKLGALSDNLADAIVAVDNKVKQEIVDRKDKEGSNIDDVLSSLSSTTIADAIKELKTMQEHENSRALAAENVLTASCDTRSVLTVSIDASNPAYTADAAVVDSYSGDGALISGAYYKSNPHAGSGKTKMNFYVPTASNESLNKLGFVSSVVQLFSESQAPYFVVYSVGANGEKANGWYNSKRCFVLSDSSQLNNKNNVYQFFANIQNNGDNHDLLKSVYPLVELVEVDPLFVNNVGTAAGFVGYKKPTNNPLLDSILYVTLQTSSQSPSAPEGVFNFIFHNICTQFSNQITTNFIMDVSKLYTQKQAMQINNALSASNADLQVQVTSLANTVQSLISALFGNSILIEVDGKPNGTMIDTNC